MATAKSGKLNPQRSMEVCLQCHLETSSEKLPHAVVRLERAPFSFRPGEPLAPGKIYDANAYSLADRFTGAHANPHGDTHADANSLAHRFTSAHTNPHPICQPNAKQPGGRVPNEHERWLAGNRDGIAAVHRLE